MKRLKRYVESSRHTSIKRGTKNWGEQFIRRFEASLSTRELLPRGSKILVAVSGGPDSMTLLSLLSTLAPKYSWSLRVAHINYHLRGRDSLADENLVRTTAKKFHVPISVFSSRVKQKKYSEEHLRDLRYAFFERVRKKYRLDYIVTAHTQNDVAETVLLNLFRGAGPFGLSPFTRSHSALVRPLLMVPRHEIERYLKERAIPFRLDRSNANPRYTRNRIRQTIIPLIEREHNPNIVATLARSAELLSVSQPKVEDFPLLVQQSSQIFFCARSEFLALSPALQLRFLSRLFRRLLTRSPSRAFLGEVTKAIRSTKSKIRTVSNRHLSVRVFSDRVEFALPLK